MLHNGLKIRGNIFRGGSSPPARTNLLLVRLISYEDQERATLKPCGKVGGAFDQQDVSRFI